MNTIELAASNHVLKPLLTDYDYDDVWLSGLIKIMIFLSLLLLLT